MIVHFPSLWNETLNCSRFCLCITYHRLYTDRTLNSLKAMCLLNVKPKFTHSVHVGTIKSENENSVQLLF